MGAATSSAAVRILGVLLAPLPALLGVLALAAGAQAPALELPDQDAPPPVAGVLTVVLFACHDCPICTSSMPEFQRIADDYRGRGVSLSVVLEDGDLTPQGVSAWAAAYCPRLQPMLDADHARARSLQAHTTPEAVVLGRDGRVRYRGRIDDSWAAIGRPRAVPTSHDLRAALDALLAGAPVPQPTTPTVGCIIDFDERRKP